MNKVVPGFLMQNKPKADSAIMTIVTDSISFEITAQEDEILYVDWGNGDEVIYILTGLPTIISKTYDTIATRIIILSGYGVKTISHLSCPNCFLTHLNVSQLKALIDLDCSHNSLTTFNLPDQTVLKKLDCSMNNLNVHSINQIFSDLVNSGVSNGRLNYQQVINTEATGQGLTDKATLEGRGWIISEIAPESFFVTNKYSVSFVVNAPSGTTLNIDWGNGTTQSISMTGLNIEIKKIYSNTNWKTIIFSGTGNTQMTILQCPYNKITSLDISKNTSLLYFDCTGNFLKYLDISKNIELKTVFCGLNNLEINSINFLFYNLSIFGKTHGVIYCNQTPAMPPTGIGLDGKAILITNSWTLTTD